MARRIEFDFLKFEQDGVELRPLEFQGDYSEEKQGLFLLTILFEGYHYWHHFRNITLDMALMMVKELRARGAYEIGTTISTGVGLGDSVDDYPRHF